MNLLITYDELSLLIEKRFKVRPQLNIVDDKTLAVSYKPKRFIPTMNITIRIEGITNDVINLSYDCSGPMSLLIAGAVGFIQESMASLIRVDTNAKRFSIYPKSIEKLKGLLEQMNLIDVSLAPNSADIKLELK
jgi:hypothetical protein